MAESEVHMEKDYTAAMRLAKKILAQWSSKTEKEITQPRQGPAALPDGPDTCPITGLKILTKPEWTNIDLGQGVAILFLVEN